MLAQQADAGSVADRYGWKPTFVSFPARGINPRVFELQSAAGSTVPSFTLHVKSTLTGQSYTVQSIGSSPVKTRATTTVTYVPIAVRVRFPDGTVLDPTKPGCNDTVSVVDRFYGSPLFHNVPLTSNGIKVGNTQIIDAFQRAEYWRFLANTRYHMLLAPSGNPIIVNVKAPSGSTTQAGSCSGKNHNLGIIDPNFWNGVVVGLANKYATTTQLPLAMAYNVVLGGPSGCCIIGYHFAYGRGSGTQTYAVGAYTDAGIFSPGLEDIHAWTHEIGEWANDPFVNNNTPAWGHVGQVRGCQSNFEVGDPLTGTPFIVHYNGFTYHPQEMAFISWFYRTATAWGTGGLYSFEGTFTTAQGTCN
jgi:hypothetical protein